MEKTIIFITFLAWAAAAPGVLVSHEAHYIDTVPLTKTTITRNSQVVDHGSTLIAHAPVIPVHHVPILHGTQKSTITKTSQVVDHGSTLIAHTPVVSVHHAPVQKVTVTKNSQVVDHGSTLVAHSPVVHTVPVSRTTSNSHVVNHGAKLLVHSPVVHHVPVHIHEPVLVKSRSGDSAVSHHSSTVHETVPLVAVHHH